jgi:hypothetical protein
VGIKLVRKSGRPDRQTSVKVPEQRGIAVREPNERLPALDVALVDADGPRNRFVAVR